MSLCQRWEQRTLHHRPQPASQPPDLTPEEREEAQEVILARWLALSASKKNIRLNLERERRGMPIPDVPTIPERVIQTLTYRGQTRTLRQWAQVTGWSEVTLWERVRRGWPINRILTLKP